MKKNANFSDVFCCQIKMVFFHQTFPTFFCPFCSVIAFIFSFLVCILEKVVDLSSVE